MSIYDGLSERLVVDINNAADNFLNDDLALVLECAKNGTLDEFLENYVGDEVDSVIGARLNKFLEAHGDGIDEGNLLTILTYQAMMSGNFVEALKFYIKEKEAEASQ